MTKRHALPMHTTGTSDQPWDGPAMMDNMDDDGDEAYYRSAFAWQDPNADAASRDAYQFLHHEVASDGTIGAANMTACRSCIATLNGARGGTDLPEAERRSVYDHLAQHMRDAGAEPPDLRSWRPAGVEHRFARASTLELRKLGDATKVDMFIPFDSPSEDLGGPMGGFTEVIRSSAFNKTLSDGADVMSLWNHDPSFVLGRRSNQTLQLEVRDDGLHATCQLDAGDMMHQHFARRIERRDVTGTSFSFNTIRDKWNEETVDGKPNTMRELLEVRLIEVSPVSFPAYPQSDAQARSVIDLAAARSGLDVGVLAAALSRSAQRRFAADDVAQVRQFLRELEAFLPAAAAPAAAVDLRTMRARLDVISREHQLAS